MARKWGGCDFRQLKNLQEKLNKLQRDDFKPFVKKLQRNLLQDYWQR